MKAYCVIAAIAAAVVCGFASCGGNSDNGISGDIPLEMVLISGGSFTMGSDAAGDAPCIAPKPAHTVHVNSFYMGKYQVTQAQYYSVMGENPSFFQAPNLSNGMSGNNHPVENVNWYNAVEFCNKLSGKEGLTPAYDIDTINKDPNNLENLDTIKWTVTLTNGNGYRLPTEAEWEYACRAGTTTAYNTGSAISDETGWYGANSNGRTHVVGEKPANLWGLCDMHGNVWEWCWDFVTYVDSINVTSPENYYDDPATDTNPLGLASGNRRAERGASWKSPQNRVISAYRERYQPQNSNNDLGFRVVRPVSNE